MMADFVPRDMFDFDRMRKRMNRMFEETRLPMPWLLEEEGALTLDIYEDTKAGEVVVKASLPGFQRDDVQVAVENGILSITAQHVEEEEEQSKDRRYYRRERRMGSVNRRVALPGVVQDNAAKAEMKDGVLTVRLPLAASAKPKQITIT